RWGGELDGGGGGEVEAGGAGRDAGARERWGGVVSAPGEVGELSGASARTGGRAQAPDRRGSGSVKPAQPGGARTSSKRTGRADREGVGATARAGKKQTEAGKGRGRSAGLDDRCRGERDEDGRWRISACLQRPVRNRSR